MSKKTGIWLDSAQAIIVSFVGPEMTMKVIESGVENRIHHEGEGDKGVMFGSQPINRQKKYDRKKNDQVNRYLAEVLDEIRDTHEIYIFGPAGTKVKIRKMIEAEKELESKLKGVEAADSMTNNQIVQKVKAFYSIAD